jgi:hypothetical protein
MTQKAHLKNGIEMVRKIGHFIIANCSYRPSILAANYHKDSPSSSTGQTVGITTFLANPRVFKPAIAHQVISISHQADPAFATLG